MRIKTVPALKVTYTDMVEYVLSMAKPKNTDEFNQTLGLVNAVRKYFSDLLAKRKTASTDEPPTSASGINFNFV